jgi:FMN phosphatase YigB (HAD superfamily)
MKTRLLVCDLDNTLYDWVAYFVPSFYAMVDEVIRLTGCDREQLLDDFRAVHRAHRDSEHPFALLETAVIRQHYGNRTVAEIAKQLDPAFHAFNSSRKHNLKLYPGVRRALDELRHANVVLVAHTESKLHAVVDRLTRLDLTNYFRHIYCRERSKPVFGGISDEASWLKNFPMDRVRELSHHQRKPDPSVLVEICERENLSTGDAAYVGDSLVRDVLLARLAGSCAIWAKYGTAHTRDEYQKLVRVSHWTEEDVAHERRMGEQARDTRPDYVLEHSFDEILGPLLGDTV